MNLPIKFSTRFIHHSEISLSQHKPRSWPSSKQPLPRPLQTRPPTQSSKNATVMTASFGNAAFISSFISIIKWFVFIILRNHDIGLYMQMRSKLWDFFKKKTNLIFTWNFCWFKIWLKGLWLHFGLGAPFQNISSRFDVRQETQTFTF